MGYRIIICVTAALFLAWLAGLVLFIGSVPVARASSQAPPQIDAIVVLTGGERRLREGLRLLREKKARRLFISGVDSSIPIEDLFSAIGIIDSCCIDIGRQATNTRENAMETRRWMDERGFASLFLVTANYHMPRADVEFRRAMPRLRIILHPVFPSNIGSGELWWLDWRGGWLALSEYNKYLLTILSRSFHGA